MNKNQSFTPIERNCPAEKDRKELWVPETKPLRIGSTIIAITGEKSIEYRCTYSNRNNCKICLQNGSYKKPNRVKEEN